jgi:DNA-binding CsgD family transcriptional regulator
MGNAQDNILCLELDPHFTCGGVTIMGQLQNPYTLVQAENAPASSNILADFYIKNHHYLVIYSENYVETLTDFNSRVFPMQRASSVVGQLKLYEKDCVVVEVEYYQLKNGGSDITTLLTERELQIVQLTAQGHSNKQIAIRLHISEWTVSTHLRRIFAKLGVDSRAAMVYRCSSLLNDLEQLII